MSYTHVCVAQISESRSSTDLRFVLVFLGNLKLRTSKEGDLKIIEEEVSKIKASKVVGKSMNVLVLRTQGSLNCKYFKLDIAIALMSTKRMYHGSIPVSNFMLTIDFGSSRILITLVVSIETGINI